MLSALSCLTYPKKREKQEPAELKQMSGKQLSREGGAFKHLEILIPPLKRGYQRAGYLRATLYSQCPEEVGVKPLLAPMESERT